MPLIIAGPGVQAGTQCNIPVVQWDFLPTVHDYAMSRQPLPADLDGGSLRSVLENGNRGRVRRPVEGMVFHYPCYFAPPLSVIRLGDYKLMEHLLTGEQKLFNVATDYREKHNLIEKYPQNIQPYLDMIDGQRMDLNKFRYKDFDELKLYCYRVAGTVGLMTQNVMGIDSAYTSAPWSAKPDPSEAAIALGIANQLTNILRDVGEDRQRGRIYLPQEDIEKFNYSEEKLLKGEINKQWKALMNFQLTRARDWFQKSEDGIKWLSSDARWPVWTSLRLYRGILDSIERLDYDVFNNRAFVKNSVKAFEIPISFLISRIK